MHCLFWFAQKPTPIVFLKNEPFSPNDFHESSGKQRPINNTEKETYLRTFRDNKYSRSAANVKRVMLIKMEPNKITAGSFVREAFSKRGFIYFRIIYGYVHTATAVLKTPLLQKPSNFLWSQQMLSGLTFQQKFIV